MVWKMIPAESKSRFRGLVPETEAVLVDREQRQASVSKNGIPRGRFFVEEIAWTSSFRDKLTAAHNREPSPTSYRVRRAISKSR